MPVPGLDRDRCLRRNSAAARKGFNAAPVRLFATAPPAAETGRLVTARGTLPASDAQALAKINAALGRDGDPLKPEDVHLVYAEAANTNFIADRWMFLDRSTLQAIAADATAGFAFMNSHRTGGLSTPTELPFGRTFAGRYERWEMPGGANFERALVGVYMLAGTRPNGDSGPSTDDLAAGIRGGTIFDVSIGLYGGRDVCDVCGEELYAYDAETGRYLCQHAPGTHRKMADEQIQAQQAKGVPGGEATYSYVDARPGEVSAVFDGAVPGAGFRKALSLSRRGEMSPTDLAEARAAFRPFLTRGGRSRPTFSDARSPTMPMTLNSLLSRLGLAGDTEIADLHEDDMDQARLAPIASRARFSPGEVAPAVLVAERIEPAPAPPAVKFSETAEGKAMAERLAAQDAELARLTAEADANRKAKVQAEAHAFAEKLAAPGAMKIVADQQAVARTAYAQAAEDDRANPLAEGSRLSLLGMLMDAVPDRSQAFAASVHGKAVFSAESVARGGESETPDPANVARLMALAGLPA